MDKIAEDVWQDRVVWSQNIDEAGDALVRMMREADSA